MFASLLRYRRGAVRAYMLYTAAWAFLFALIVTVNQVYYVEWVGLNPLQLVLVGTLLETTAFLLEVPTGIVADTYSRRLSVVIGVVLVGIGFTIEGLFPRFEAILLSQIIWGAGATFISGALDAWITDEVGVERVGKLYLRAGQVGNIMGLVGIGVSVLLASGQLNLPILFGGLGLVLLGGALWLTMPETGFHPTPREERNSWRAMRQTVSTGINRVRLSPILLTFVLISALGGMHSEGFDRLWTAHTLANYRLPALGNLDSVAWFGLIGAVGMVLSIIGNEIANRRLNMSNPILLGRVLGILYVARGVLVIGFALAGQFWLALLAFWGAGMLRSVLMPVFNTWLNYNIQSDVRATMISFYSQMDAFGQIAGGPVVGWIGLRVSLRAAIAMTGLLLLPMWGLCGLASRHQQAATENE